MASKFMYRFSAALAISALATAPLATSAGNNRETGMPAAETEAQRTLKIDSSTIGLNIEHLETVRIQNAAGQSFTWTFNTPGEASFALQRIAPAGFDAGKAIVHVEHPWSHRWLAN